ncbi:ATP synthase subunit I [Spirulina major CS-329]|jgi:ATP synthase protein I|uniref:ATP synthase subunit I n=1 Tax=Spirulina TaxID=1154 RepID=UPI0023313B8F|nr:MULTISPECIES: ATP synthase subunit I [Spirulina]MDB9495569.1 ATP synthase subunit I [Spirulina subsalsa CS-330]MDB9503920.1 ATP synthase subunit I [Spirulina major CS-329]
MVNEPNANSVPESDTAPSPADPAIADSSAAMQDYYQLKQTLLWVTLGITAVVFISVWITYSLNIALNYLIGACVGVVYLGMLARDVERIGVQKKRLGSNRLAPFIGLIVIATQWQTLHIVPIFLGFITYKAAIIIYVVQSTLRPVSSS